MTSSAQPYVRLSSVWLRLARQIAPGTLALRESSP